MNSLTKAFSFFEKKPFILYLLWSIIAYSFFFYVYEPVTLGLDMEDHSILALPTIVGLTLFQAILGHSLWSKAFLPHAITGLGWALTFPLLFHWSYTKPFYFYEFANDYLFGIFLFMGLVLSQYWLSLKTNKTKALAWSFSIIDFLLLLVPLAQIFYYCIYWHCISPPTLMAFYMTNFMESLGFLKNTIGVFGIIGLVLFCGLLIFLAYKGNKSIPHLGKSSKASFITKYQKSLMGIAVVSLLAYLPFYLFIHTCIITNWRDVTAYMIEMQKFHEYHEHNYKDLMLTTKETTAQKLPGTVIVVIGESASKNYMKAYNHAFHYENTPWLTKQSQSDEFFLFNKAYSSYVQTVPTLERALTEKNQYKDKPFTETVSILDIAKKAGYKTTWLSNQGMYGDYDTAISLVAKTADEAKWSHDSYMFSDKYDGALLPLLEQVDPKVNNFIVLHLMGSHIYYNDRYPSEYSRWKKSAVPDGLEAYSNSILYTDAVLEQIHTYAKEHLNLQAMIYFSDHGESIDKSHNPDIFDFDMTRIPLFVYLSPAYQQMYPDIAANLRGNENQVFTNDLIYNLVTGILHAPSNRYDPVYDLSSPSYNINLENALTMLSTVHVNTDPALKK